MAIVARRRSGELLILVFVEGSEIVINDGGFLLGGGIRPIIIIRNRFMKSIEIIVMKESISAIGDFIVP